MADNCSSSRRATAGRSPRRGLAFGVNEVGHGLGLVQTELAVQEGAPGEFAGSGGLGAGGPAGRHDHPRGHAAAVTEELHRVFARVAVGGERAGPAPDQSGNFFF